MYHAVFANCAPNSTKHTMDKQHTQLIETITPDLVDGFLRGETFVTALAHAGHSDIPDAVIAELRAIWDACETMNTDAQIDAVHTHQQMDAVLRALPPASVTLPSAYSWETVTSITAPVRSPFQSLLLSNWKYAVPLVLVLVVAIGAYPANNTTIDPALMVQNETQAGMEMTSMMEMSQVADTGAPVGDTVSAKVASNATFAAYALPAESSGDPIDQIVARMTEEAANESALLADASEDIALLDVDAQVITNFTNVYETP